VQTGVNAVKELVKSAMVFCFFVGRADFNEQSGHSAVEQAVGQQARARHGLLTERIKAPKPLLQRDHRRWGAWYFKKSVSAGMNYPRYPFAATMTRVLGTQQMSKAVNDHPLRLFALNVPRPAER